MYSLLWLHLYISLQLLVLPCHVQKVIIKKKKKKKKKTIQLARRKALVFIVFLLVTKIGVRNGVTNIHADAYILL